MRAWPPDDAVHAAVSAASGSPCAKSKRGVCVYRVLPVTAHRPGRDEVVVAEVTDLLSVGYNRQPGGECDGVTCRPVCGRICVHAEMAAIRNAVAVASAALGVPTPRLVGCEALHVKVVNDQLVPGGGPSCWQCSREVLDVGLDAFWLYENTADGPMWIRYTAESFHSATLAEMAREDAVTAARDADQLKVTVQARQAVADVVLQRDEARRERNALLGLLGLQTPWPLADVLERLADAAEHLLGDHNCDDLGHEGKREAMLRGRVYVGAIRDLLKAGL